jgi:hypothetical protein
MAKRDTGTRTMTNSEMQDRTTADVIGKAAGWDQRHSVGSCDVADLADRCPTCLVKMEWITAITNALAAASETRVACERSKRTMPNTPGAHPHFNDRGAVRWYTSLADGLAAARGECKKVFIELGRAA